MTNFERIKGYSFEEMTEFLTKIIETVGYDMENAVCDQCRRVYVSCPYEDSQDPYKCRYVEKRKTIEYWLNMSPNP